MRSGLRRNTAVCRPLQLLVALLCSCCWGAAPARVGAEPLSRTGLPTCLCVVLGGPPKAVVEAASSGDALIYVQCLDAQQATACRQAAEAAGLLGKRIFVDCGDWSRIQLADNLADAVVVSGDGRVEDREVLRVLRPGGKAFIGDRQLVKPVPTGTDTWSHPYHGPDNNPLSTDRVARAPYLTQFLAEPLFSSQPEVTVAAGGRIFKAFGHMTFRAYQNPSINTLTALNAYNGSILWKREIKAGFMIHRNTMIATPDTLLMADDESCKLFDAATGQIKGEITVPAGISDGPVWKWMALENGILYALVGGKEVPAPVAKGSDTRIGGWPWGMWPGYEYADPKTAWGFGRTFVAIDLKTRELRWNHREEQYIDSRGLCMRNGRIYFYCPDRFLACIDAKTGSPVWRNADASLLSAIGPNQKAQHYMTGFATSTYMKATDKVLTFAGPQRKALVAASTEDGRLLWKRDDGNFQLVLRDDAIYALGQQGGTSYRLDYAGSILSEFTGRRACTRATGSIDSVFCRAIEGTIRWELGTNALQHIAPMRPACHDGVIISDGLLTWGPWICGCHLTLVGAICLTPAGDFNFDPTPDESKQLQQARADLAQVQAFNTQPNDWASYLGNSQRSRTSSAAVAEKAALAWTFNSPTASVPTAPVSAGGVVFTAGGDGAVRAIDAASGKARWAAYTGGEILFPPAVWNNRVYVGSNDGRVYAFEAATGDPLWQFRAAPAERKIPVYGQIESTWPVAGGVVVGDGVVYAAAGISHFDGTHVYALDAITGRMRWHNGSSGSLDTKVRNGISLCGALKLSGTELSFPGGNVYPTATYDTRTGQCSNKPAGPHTTLRIFLHPRKLWEPIDTDDIATPRGHVKVGPPRGGRGHPITLTLNGKNAPAWSARTMDYHGAIATANALLVLGRTQQEASDSAPCNVTAFKLDDGSVLWSQPLPAMPVHYGVAVDSAGRTIVTLENGQTVCFR